MAKKLFRPKLIHPEGINNFPGTVFRCFTRGETMPFKFTFKDEDGKAPDVTDWVVEVIFSPQMVPNSNCEPTDDMTVVEIPMTDLVNAIFQGEVTNLDTQNVPAGLCYAMARYTRADGVSNVIDMAILEVYPTLTFPNF